MIHRAFFRFNIVLGATIILLVSACTASPTTEPLAQATPEVTIQGDTSGKEEVQTIELDNCGGKADTTRIEQRTQSVDVTISTELAAKIGASVEVVSAEVQAAVSLAITPGSERSTSIHLVAPPDTRMVFQLVWVGNEQIGIVQNIHNSDIPVAFRSFLPTDVRIRSQSDIGCSGSSSPQAVFEPTTLPQTSFSTTEPFCAFVTQSQVEELKTLQDVASAIRKAEEFAGYRQNDYTEGSAIPAGVLVATDLRSTNLEQFGVTPINNQGGWGLFLTTREFQAPNAGTYWCIQETVPNVLSTPSTTIVSMRICGDTEGAFRDGLNVTNPLFWRPEGFVSGWLSSNPATIVLPDGTSKILESQFVLVVQDLPWVQVQGIGMANGKAQTWGCWYTTNQFVEQDAIQDMCIKRQGGSFGRLYRVSSDGVEELGTTQTVSCP